MGAGPRMGKVAGGGGIGVIVIALIAMFFGVDPSFLLSGLDQGTTYTTTDRRETPPADDQQAQFVAAVLGETEDVWNSIFADLGADYSEPTLVLFESQVTSACGMASSATGPFYCPGDRQVYIDLDFFTELERRFGAPGDFARAYVIAHEIGHHVQTLLGISAKVQDLRRRLPEVEANRYSVLLELQADCFAGVWARTAQEARQILEAGDIEEALGAAAAIGDDRLQRRARGYVTPDSFTHGTSEQRTRWFERGMRTGDIDTCDTFAAEGA